MSEQPNPPKKSGKHVPVEAPTIQAMTPEEKKAFNFWDNVPPPEKLDTDEFYRYGRTFFVVSAGYPTDEVIEYTIQTAMDLFKKGYKMRYSRIDSDLLSRAVYEHVYNMNKEKAEEKSSDMGRGPAFMSAMEPLMSRYVEVFVPWESFGDTIPVMHIDSAKPTYRAHALTNEYHGSFKTQGPSTRRLFAVTMHHIFGSDCATPIDAMICYSDCGSQGVKDIKKGITGIVSFPITSCEHGGIPIFNVRDKANREKLTTFVNDLR
jgi:hypothetical protein